MIDVLILNYNDAKTTCKIVDTFIDYKEINTILIVDNNSTDDSYNTLLTYCFNEKVRIIKTNKNGGYGYGNNIGFSNLKNTGSKYVLLCNPDVNIDELTIVEMETYLDTNQNCLAVAPFMLNINKEKDYHTAYSVPTKLDYIASMGLISGKLFSNFYYSKTQLDSVDPIDVGTVAGSLYMINLDLLPDPCIYDEEIFLYCEETVLGIKAKEMGLRIVLLPYLVFIHEHAASISKSYKKEIQRRRLMVDSRLYLLKKYYKANKVEIGIAKMLSFLSYIEVSLREFYRTVLQRKQLVRR